MNVSLTRQLKQFVAEKVASGSYETASEVIRDGLRLLQEGDKLQAIKELRQEILVGIKEANQGKFFLFTEATRDRQIDGSLMNISKFDRLHCCAVRGVVVAPSRIHPERKWGSYNQIFGEFEIVWMPVKRVEVGS